MNKDDLLNQYKILHKKSHYGNSSVKMLKDILPIVKEINPKSILDYGCGRSNLIDKLPAEKKYRYDPAIKKYNILTKQSIDLVICTDVLEHILEEDIKDTLLKIKSICSKVIFCITVIPAVNILPNGTNAHCTVKSIDWWMLQILAIFEEVTFVKNIRDVKFLCKTW